MTNILESRNIDEFTPEQSAAWDRYLMARFDFIYHGSRYMRAFQDDTDEQIVEMLLDSVEQVELTYIQCIEDLWGLELSGVGESLYPQVLETVGPSEKQVSRVPANLSIHQFWHCRGRVR